MRTRQGFALIGMVLIGMAGGVAAADLQVSNPYVRAVPPGMPNSASFMQVSNHSATAAALVGAESDIAKVVELHTHINDNGMMRMRKIERIDVPANGSVSLQPGGHHVMLIGLNRELKPGDMVDITLVADDGTRVPVKALVKLMQMKLKMPMKSHGQGMMKNPCAPAKPMN